MSAYDYAHSWLEKYEEAIYADFEEEQAKRAEARRRIHVDSDGVVIGYVDPSEEKDTPAA